MLYQLLISSSCFLVLREFCREFINFAHRQAKMQLTQFNELPTGKWTLQGLPHLLTNYVCSHMCVCVCRAGLSPCVACHKLPDKQTLHFELNRRVNLQLHIFIPCKQVECGGGVVCKASEEVEGMLNMFLWRFPTLFLYIISILQRSSLSTVFI